MGCVGYLRIGDLMLVELRPHITLYSLSILIMIYNCVPVLFHLLSEDRVESRTFSSEVRPSLFMIESLTQTMSSVFISHSEYKNFDCYIPGHTTIQVLLYLNPQVPRCSSRIDPTFKANSFQQVSFSISADSGPSVE